MTERLYLHVGAPKSGTTYLQSVLRANRERLAEAGVLVVGRNQTQVVHAALVIRHDRRVATMHEHERRAWDDLVESIHAWTGPTAVMSYELLSAAHAQAVAGLLARFPDLEVHLVFTARDFGRALPSAWQERLKFGLEVPLEEWEPPDPDLGQWVEWGWRTMDPVHVLDRWAADVPAERVHVVTVPRRGAGPHELWDRFAHACGLPADGLDLGVTTANESLSAGPAELLRRVNTALRPPIDTSREFSRWVRDYLAHTILVPLGDQEGLGMTDAQYAEALARSSETIRELSRRGYDVQGDLEDIRATRPSGRTPGEVDDAELVDLAARTIAELLLALRESSVGTAGRPVAADGAVVEHEPRTLRTRGRSAARRAARGIAAVQLNHRTEELAEELTRLEDQVHRGRELQRRVADLEDLVLELLVPTADQDDDQLAESIRRYRGGSL